MSEYDDIENINDLDTATPLDGASATEVYQALRQIKAILKTTFLNAHQPNGSLRTTGSGVVDSGALVNGSITTEKLADNAVTRSKLATNAVGASELGDAVVSTIKVIDSAITEAKLADNAVTASKISSNAVGLGKLLATSTNSLRPVITNTIADGAVTDQKITSIGLNKLLGGTLGDTLKHDGSNWVAVSSTGSAASLLSIAVVIDSKSSGVEGGGPANAGEWTERDLGQQADPDNIISFVGNAFSLVEGDYLIWLEVPGYNVGDHQARLLKMPDSGGSNSTELLGGSVQGPDGISSIVTGVFTVSDAADSYKVEHWTQNANSTNGFGSASNSGENEIYTKGWLVKLS